MCPEILLYEATVRSDRNNELGCVCVWVCGGVCVCVLGRVSYAFTYKIVQHTGTDPWSL